MKRADALTAAIKALLDNCPGCGGAGGESCEYPEAPCVECGRNCWQTEDQIEKRVSFRAALAALEDGRGKHGT